MATRQGDVPMTALRRASKAWLCALVLVAIAAPRGAAAQDAAGVFTVANVAVDATAASAIAAREAARLDGQRRAFGLLMARLTLAADRGRIPKPPDSRLTDMVRDFEVANERSSAVRYLADYTFRFRPEDVRRLLGDAGIPYSETPSKPVIVLPVLHRDGSSNLWDDPNPWRDAWANFKGQAGLVPLVVPLDEAADVAAIGPGQAVAGDPDALAAIAGRYGGSDLLIAEATIGDGGQLDAVVRRVAGGAPTPISAASYRPNPGEDAGAVRARAVAASDGDLEAAWKQQTLLSFGSEAALTADVALGSLGDWLFIRDHLVGVAAIRHADILSLGKQAARVEIHYTGDPARLQLALAQRDLALTGSGASWTLQRRGGGAPAQ
jgi:hypothetical protein